MAFLKVKLIIGLGAFILLAQAPNPPSAPQACAGAVTILLNGSPLTTGCTINILPGNGIIASPMINSSINGVNLTFSYNPVLIPTHDSIHTNENFCNSVDAVPQYTCTLPDRTLTLGYSVGQSFLLQVETTCSANCTLNIDGNGARSIKQSDGITDPNGLLIAKQARFIWFDGTLFRLM